MQRYNSSMAQIREQMVFEEYIDSVLQLDDEQFDEYYDSLNQEQQEELNEIIGKIAKGLGKIAVSPITLPYKVGKAAVKGVARAVTSKPAKAVGGDVVGVDFIPAKNREKDKPFFIEVNSNPGLKGIEGVFSKKFSMTKKILTTYMNRDNWR